MATSPVSPPSGPGQGPGPGGGFSSPAAPQSDPNAAQLLKFSMDIVAASRMIAQKVPAATPEVRQINDLVAKIQENIKGQQAPAETQAPPV